MKKSAPNSSHNKASSEVDNQEQQKSGAAKLFSKSIELVSQIPKEIWLALLGAIFSGGALSEWWKVQTFSSYVPINEERIKALEGKWEGYGVQKVEEKESVERLKKGGVTVESSLNREIAAGIKDCTFKQSEYNYKDVVWFPAHLQLKAEKTSQFSQTNKLVGTLETTPRKNNPQLHASYIYHVDGRLEQSGRYIRLDYSIDNSQSVREDFGTLLLQINSDGKLCGKFISYGPVSRGIVEGDYVFTKAPHQ